MACIFIKTDGRRLAGMNGNGKNITFKYNDSGIRTQKVVDGVTTTYHLVGGKVTYEDNGEDRIYYSYDASEHLISMNLSTKNDNGTWTNGEEYFNIRNAQGDIIGLCDKGGAEVVSYSYDSFGKLTPSKIESDDANDTDKNGITGLLASIVGIKNPYLYRGYRFDSETGLYYLQSRYYNPSWGRFLNADAIIGSAGELLGHNVFAYCKNNVVNGKDPSGFRPVLTEGEETDEMRDASYKAMSKAEPYYSPQTNKETKWYNDPGTVYTLATNGASTVATIAGESLKPAEAIASFKVSSILSGIGAGISEYYIYKNSNLDKSGKIALTILNIELFAAGVGVAALLIGASPVVAIGGTLMYAAFAYGVLNFHTHAFDGTYEMDDLLSNFLP